MDQSYLTTLKKRTLLFSISSLTIEVSTSFSLSSMHLRKKSTGPLFGIWVEVNSTHKSVELISWCCLRYPFSLPRIKLFFFSKIIFSCKSVCMLLIALLTISSLVYPVFALRKFDASHWQRSFWLAVTSLFVPLKF